MDFELSAEQIAIQNMARQFGQNEIAPHAGDWDRSKHFPKDVLRRAAALGFASLYTRPDVGGSDVGRLTATLVFEELSAACPSTTAYLTIHNMVTWMIDRFGSPELREQWCPRMTQLDLFGSYCLTEPGSGSDAASLRTRAERHGDTYRITGTKAFVSGGGETDVLIVMARTGDASPRGISSFVVPARQAGISYGDNEKKMGWNSQPTRVVNFDQVEVHANQRLGQEGEGFKFAMKGLDGGRINIATCSVGAARAALEAARRHLLVRQQFGKPLAEFQALQFKLADLATELVAARQMIRLAASKLDNQNPEASLYAAMAKRFATDAGFHICNEALQLFGGYGYTQDYPVEKLMRDTRVHQILEGTNEIMRLIISRRVLEQEGVFS